MDLSGPGIDVKLKEKKRKKRMQHLISVNTSSPFIIISSSDKLP
jgi:hypothetical protein